MRTRLDSEVKRIPGKKRERGGVAMLDLFKDIFGLPFLAAYPAWAGRATAID
ncbi:MAG TPA: hypothetical protein VLH40_07430 [Atribacteraceae bacterium]|nr:hypothetical protein [Atribacteraceae bacterium]